MSKIISIFRDYGMFVGVIVIYRKIFQLIFNFFITHKLNLKNARIHPSAKIIGLSNIKIGNNFSAGKDFWIEAVSWHGDITYSPQIIIKDNVAINDSVHIGATNYVEIGNNVLMASKIYISDHSHGLYAGDYQSDPETPPNIRPVSCNKQVVIEDNVWLGESVSVLAGVTIGRGCIIGSNSVVSKSIPPYSIAVGSPARVVKMYSIEKKEWQKA